MAKMTESPRAGLVRHALAACAAAALAFSGCGRGEQPPAAQGEPPADGAVASRLEDPAYKAALSNQLSEMEGLLKTRGSLVAKLRELEGASAPEAELAGLRARIEDVDKAIEDNRRHSTAIVRDRIHRDLEKTNLK